MKCRARTAEDVEKAYRDGRNQGIKESVTFFAHVGLLFLADKRGWKTRSLDQYVKYMIKYSEMFNSNDVTLDDIKQILKDEYDIELNIK